MLDDGQGGTVGRRPITGTDREWAQQCQNCQPHGEETKGEDIHSAHNTTTTTEQTETCRVGMTIGQNGMTAQNTNTND